MNRAGQILGKTRQVSEPEALLLMESSVSEGITIPEHWPYRQADHLFGRVVRFHRGRDLAFISGMAAGGLRTAAFLRAGELAGCYQQVRDLARKHIPALIYCLTGQSADSLPEMEVLKATGAFVWHTGSAQEAVNMAPLAHYIAEEVLLPGIILVPCSDASTTKEIHFPGAEAVRQKLGEPDDSIPTLTPAQQIVFGKSRRRIPNWMNPDLPTFTGSVKDGMALALEMAAQKKYISDYLPELLEKTFQAIPASSTTGLQPLERYKTDDAAYLLLYWGIPKKEIERCIRHFRETERIKVGALEIRQLHPLPETEIMRLTAGKKAVTLLEPWSALSGGKVMEPTPNGKYAPEWYTGVFGPDLTEEQLQEVFRNMLPKGTHRSDFTVGIPFTRSNSAYPQHEVLVQTINRLYPESGSWSLDAPLVNISQVSQSETTGRLPWAIRRQKDQGAPYSRIARFFHDTGALYADGAWDELVADPFQAIPAIPAGSAGLASDPSRELLPVFAPEKCTGCGECLVQCPHAALPPIVIRVEELLRSGMEIARKNGTPLSQLTPMLKNLGILSAQVIRNRELPVNNLSDFLPEAFVQLHQQMGLTGEKLEKAQQEINVLVDSLSGMPMAVTDTFFHQPEQLTKGQGGLFSLALDTQACTGCGICAEVCAPGALEMTPLAHDIIRQATAAMDIWEQLPDTKADVIARLHQSPEYDSLAAILLSRYNYLSMTGPGPDTAASGKTMLHLVTAMAESITQPRIAAAYKTIEQLTRELGENIRKILSEALPSEDSLGLISAITNAGGRKLPLDEIIGTLGKLEHLKLVDTAALQRKIQLANDLKDLLWLLKEGPTGSGRAHYTLVLPDRDIAAAGTYPFHPFQVPVAMVPGSMPEWAAGQFEAHLRHSLDNIRLLRRAQLESRNQYRPEFNASTIADLAWEDLTVEEKALVPPLLLVYQFHELPTGFLEQVNSLLVKDLPVKIVVLDHAGPAPGHELQRYFSTRNTLWDVARAGRNAFVLAGTLGARETLFNGMLQGLSSYKPALFILHTPDPGKHTAAAKAAVGLADLALQTRAFPVYQFNPEKATTLSAPGISLAHNPAERNEWTTMTQAGQPEEAALQTPVTFANWLFSLQTWQDHFTLRTEPDAAAVPLHQYLQLAPEAQQTKKAVFTREDPEGNTQQFEVSEHVITATRTALQAWSYLRETAGTLSAHPQQLWEEARQEISAAFEKQIKDLEADFAVRLEQAEAETTQKMRVQLREKLVRMARAAQPQPKDN
ncbi:MAG: hypothetical protein EP344_04605 [Bacteroidetes bacterium]|nr:MAG: hypothetical protein EP344_04605 [Bacteroidota bacterium]